MVAGTAAAPAVSALVPCVRLCLPRLVNANADWSLLSAEGCAGVLAFMQVPLFWATKAG